MEELKQRYGGQVCLGACCLVTLSGLIFVIIILASITTLAPDDQVVVHYFSGKEVYNGPQTTVLHPFREHSERKATTLRPLEYCTILDRLSGQLRQVEGPNLIFLNAYDEIVEVADKIVLKKDQYVRLVDQATGIARVERGPASITPSATEVSAEGIQSAVFLDTDTAVVVQDLLTGSLRLVQDNDAGELPVFFPEAHEKVHEVKELIRVPRHEALVTHNVDGVYTVYNANASTDGDAFFLPPYNYMVNLPPSMFSLVPGSQTTVAAEAETRIDLRKRKIFFEYDVRTNDNVKLRLTGTIFWQVINVHAMLATTSDPEGDVWHHARSALIQAVSKTSLMQFMNTFNDVIQEASEQQAHDGFYSERGLTLHSVELTGYEPVDGRTAEILGRIIKETTNRLNRLSMQESENEVNMAKLSADINLESQRTELITTQATNFRLIAEKDGDTEGLALSASASTFLNELSDSISNEDHRLDLYTLQHTLTSRATNTRHLSEGNATIFLTPQEMNLNLRMGQSDSMEL